MSDDDHKPSFDSHRTDTAEVAPVLPVVDSEPLDALRLPWVLEFHLIDHDVQFQAQVREALVIGRADRETPDAPDIDLSAYDAQGVSRRHAVLRARHGRLTVEDLASRNGTRLNDFDLLPNTEYRLKDGDMLTLGRLRIRVSVTVMPSRRSGEDTPLPAVGHGKRILLVTDNPHLSGALNAALERANFRVYTLPNGKAALRDMNAVQPDLLLLDLSTPDLLTFDFMRLARRRQKRRLPILALTGNDASPNRTLRADAYLGRPISLIEMVGTLAIAIGNAK